MLKRLVERSYHLRCLNWRVTPSATKLSSRSVIRCKLFHRDFRHACLKCA